MSSPTKEAPFADSSPNDSAINLAETTMTSLLSNDPPPEYSNEGYLGSKATISKQLDNDCVEIKMVVDNNCEFFD